jgi:hypothetical protein
VTRERTHYVEGRLLTAEDLTQDQQYFHEKARRHNRTLHGWGVVCGLAVEPGPGKLEVRVAPGYALDAHGDEIVIESEVSVDLCKEERNADAVRPCDSADGESPDVVERFPGQHLYIAVRYAECYSRPVPAPDGGSEEASEYSRIRETFSIRALTELPVAHHGRADSERWADRPRAESPVEPWVVLADVTVGPDLGVAKIDPVTHRRCIDGDP